MSFSLYPDPVQQTVLCIYPQYIEQQKVENSLQHITGSSSAGYLTAHLGSSLGFTIAPESLDSSAAKVRRWVSRDTFGPDKMQSLSPAATASTKLFIKK